MRVYWLVDWVWTVMAHEQKPDFVFRRNGRVHLIRRGRQFSRLLAAEVYASAVVMLDTPRSEVVWRVLATHSIRQFPLHFLSLASPCAITFHLDSSNTGYTTFRCSVKSYPLHSPVSPSLSLPYVTVCHHISTGLYSTSPCPSAGWSKKVEWGGQRMSHWQREEKQIQIFCRKLERKRPLGRLGPR
jgi:hypothetical protein